MTKSIGEGSGSLNKPDAFFEEVFNYESQLTQGYVEQVPNIGTIRTVDVPVELAGNVINEEGNKEENGEEYSTKEDIDIDGNTYLPKDFVVAACEEDSDTNSEKGFDSPNYSSDEEGERRRKFPEFCKSDLDNPKFEKGMLLGRKEVLKKAMKNYARSIVSFNRVDANDNTYPIAYAAVELETKKTWSWFLEFLIDDLGPGLNRAFDIVVPQAQHRWCVRHMYGNFKDKFKGEGLKDLLWSATRATNRYEFQVEMNKLKDMNGAAYDWLMSKDLDKWARHRFSTAPKCDMLLNNLCETFNSYILIAPDKTILTMLEMIRCNIMKRFQMKRETMSKHEGVICPKIQKMLEKIKYANSSWTL
ncbi:uncharacterized protein LOC117638427 [Prunus dulcis]|uniref:uncharacterized protein LOC117638427 n=1 Tax=Prunus dulcis TaxID=3755 RepID=UPI001482B733|nr:uncharacterized protein LOC117638427 [Prunus dulcis]